MSEFDVRVTRLSGDTYRVEVLESGAPYVIGILGLFGLGLVVHLMKEYDLTFEQAFGTIVGSAMFAILGFAGFVMWMRRKLEFL